MARGFSGQDRCQDVDQPDWNGRLQKSTLHLRSFLQQDTPGTREDAVGLRLQEAHRAGMNLRSEIGAGNLKETVTLEFLIYFSRYSMNARHC